MPDEKEAVKESFDIDRAIPLIREAVRPYPKAAMFALADEGYDSLFEALIGCILSIRTRDEDSLRIARRLFAVARTPAAIAELTTEKIDTLIAPTAFKEAKAVQIREIARRIVDEFGGALPSQYDVLISFTGVGPKCANLALGVATGVSPNVSVDIHVHRVTNRWGYVRATTPEKTMAALSTVLPEKYRVEINSLLVPFGKHICTGTIPKCGVCPLLSMCRRVGVAGHR